MSSKKSDNKDLTIHFMPYSEIEKENSSNRIKKILGIILQNKIIVLQGRLRYEEETRLIEDTMALIGNVPGFRGIEIAEISSGENGGLFDLMKHNIVKILVGERDAMTVIGPANLVKEIKRNPKKIELMLKRK
ncbi:MAG: DUF2073 domain-containing protein [Nanoarchaeota archaeon]|nr:DUF2073 domain-containing protein [Nanoarchaeota archaeon]